MLKIFIGMIIVLLIAILIWLFINRKIIKKAIHFIWAHFAVEFGKYDVEEINYDDLIEKKENHNSEKLPTFLFDNKKQEIDEHRYRHNSVFEVLTELVEEQPEFVEKIAEENRKKAEKEAEEDAKYSFPINRRMAIEIAKKDTNLKKDFCEKSSRKRNIIYFFS